MHLGLLFVLLLLVLEHDLLFVRVVARDALDFRVGWDLKLVLHVAIEEFPLLIEHVLHGPAHIIVQLLNKGMLLPVLLHLLLNEAKRAVDYLLIKLEFGLLLI